MSVSSVTESSTTAELDRDQFQTELERFLLNNKEMHTRGASHIRSLKHLFAEKKRMYPYMVFQADGLKHVIVSAVNNIVIKVWCFKPKLYKAAMKIVKLAQLDQEDIREEISVLRSRNPYEWMENQPKCVARMRVRSMLEWVDMTKTFRGQSLSESAADAAKIVVDAFYDRNRKTSGLTVIVMEPRGKALDGEDLLEWNEGDFEY